MSWNVDKLPTLNIPESHPHGCVSWNVNTIRNKEQEYVTPSRVCELKFCRSQSCVFWFGHTLTGVWVEIFNFGGFWMEDLSHPHGCVSWNYNCQYCNYIGESHPHGCVSWNSPIRKQERLKKVTPSRVCELKSGTGRHAERYKDVTPSRVCELKYWTR